MNRIGLIIALFIAAGAGLALGLFPEIDLWVAQAAYDAIDANDSLFTLALSPTVLTLRKIGSWVEILLIAPVVLSVIIKLFLPRSKMLISGRSVVFLIATLVLAPGLLVNVVLKDHWGRPRPGHILQFGGDQHFVAWWNPNGECQKNCSFVSGEASSAFWTIAAAAIAPPAYRTFAYGAALIFGITISLLRLMMGGHFLSDTIFAGVFSFLTIWLMYALIYRWRRTRLDDKAIEDGLERFSAYCLSAVSRLGHRSTNQITDPMDGEADPPLRH
jgi:lipid A 4'-phosphatase